MTIDDFDGVKHKSFGTKNTSNQDKESNISIEYEEEKDPDEVEFKKLDIGYKGNKKLNEVNEDNLEIWVDLLRTAVKDLTILNKRNQNARLNIEDLSQAMGTIHRIGNKLKTVDKGRESGEKENKKEIDKNLPTLMQIVKASDLKKDDLQNNKTAVDDFANDFYI